MSAGERIKLSVDALRKEKDRYFKSFPESPIPEQERGSFKGLSYFPYGPAYRVAARFHRNPRSDTVIMTTSRGTEQTYLRYGYFEFYVEGKQLRMEAYKAVQAHEYGEGSLFVPFRDATSGKETYGVGRYLDIKEEPSEEYILDFNLAFNPYCAYSEDYVCPLPPRENWLNVPIRAGEKMYPKSQ